MQFGESGGEEMVHVRVTCMQDVSLISLGPRFS